MSHMVIFESEEGVTGQQHCEDLDGAVGYVEALRNDQGIDRARIFRMEEVKFELTPYYVVSIADALDAPAAVIPPPPSIPDMAPPSPIGDPLGAPATTQIVEPETPFTDSDTVDPIDAVFGDAFEADEPTVLDVPVPAIPVAEAPFAEAIVPPAPVVEEELETEGAGRRGLFGR